MCMVIGTRDLLTDDSTESFIIYHSHSTSRGHPSTCHGFREGEKWPQADLDVLNQDLL